MKIETVMMRGLKIGNDFAIKGDLVDFVIKGRLHTESVVLDIDENSVTIQNEFYGPITFNIADIDDAKKRRTATVKINVGEMCSALKNQEKEDGGARSLKAIFD